jgi:hypothetical protein
MSLPSAHSAARVHRRPRENGDPGHAIFYQLAAQILPLRILALDQLQFPFLILLFTKDRICHGLMKFDKD